MGAPQFSAGLDADMILSSEKPTLMVHKVAACKSRWMVVSADSRNRYFDMKEVSECGGVEKAKYQGADVGQRTANILQQRLYTVQTQPEKSSGKEEQRGLCSYVCSVIFKLRLLHSNTC